MQPTVVIHCAVGCNATVLARKFVYRWSDKGTDKQGCLGSCRNKLECRIGIRRRESCALSCRRAPKSSETSATGNGEGEDGGTEVAALEEFVQLNVGFWSGHFCQHDVLGQTLQCIPTKLNAWTYSSAKDIALLQTLNIKQGKSKTAVDGELEEPTWVEFKQDETNLFTVERRQQIGLFPGESAYCISHQTAEMLDKVLRAGVLGEDDIEDEFPKEVKLPSRRPALVNESCLYSEDGERRVRAFHVLDSRGLLDLVGIFHESKKEESLFGSDALQDATEQRIDHLIGTWTGRAVTRRTGIYGATIAEGDTTISYHKLPDGGISQEITSTRGTGSLKVSLTGIVRGAVLHFEGGLQTILLPGGIAVTCPVSVGKSVGRSQSFYFEFVWTDSASTRRRLVRTYDTDGLVVSTTLSTEKKI